jgi:hypothetical protein
MNDTIKHIIDQIITLNPIFTGGGHVIWPGDETAFNGLTDNYGNHFYVTLPTTANIQNITFIDAQYSGCGSYRATLQIELIFALDPCYKPEKVFEILSRQLTSLQNITLVSGSFDAEKIHQLINGEPLPKPMTLVRFLANTFYYIDSENCELLCVENCC